MELVAPESRHEFPLWKLIDLVQNAGGNIDTVITIESDGEPVYIEAYITE